MRRNGIKPKKTAIRLFAEAEMMEEHVLNQRYDIEEYILGDWGE